jgi:hypothetical protein
VTAEIIERAETERIVPIEMIERSEIETIDGTKIETETVEVMEAEDEIAGKNEIENASTAEIIEATAIKNVAAAEIPRSNPKLFSLRISLEEWELKMLLWLKFQSQMKLKVL